jgi:hypothetical protein
MVDLAAVAAVTLVAEQLAAAAAAVIVAVDLEEKW